MSETDADATTLSRRERILVYVQQHPGAYFSQIQRDLGLAQGEAAYHLRVLEKSHDIMPIASARYKHYFARGAGHPMLEREVLMALALKQPRSILLHVNAHPGISSRELAARLGTTEPNLAWHLKRLRAAGLLDTRREVGAALHSLTLEPGVLQRLLETYDPLFWRVWVARFAETWGKLGSR